MTSTSDPPKRHLLGFIGALWPWRRDRGECPPDAQLAALFDGTLPASGAERMREHLAHCPRCYRSLLHLTEVSDIVAVARTRARPHPYRGLITLMGGLGVAAAALLATVTLVLDSPDLGSSLREPYLAISQAVSSGRYQPSHTGWIWRAGYVSRNLGVLDTPPSRAASTSLTVGVARGLERSTSGLGEWLEIRSNLSAVQVRCEGLPARTCERIRSLYEDVGRWAVLMHFACEPLHSGDTQGATASAWMEPDFWQDATDTLALIAEQAEQVTPQGPYARLFRNWQARSNAQDPATLCRGVPTLLSTMGR